MCVGRRPRSQTRSSSLGFALLAQVSWASPASLIRACRRGGRPRRASARPPPRTAAAPGASRYWIGVSTVAIAATNRGSPAAARAASRSLACSTGSGVPAGANSAAHWKKTASKPDSVSVGTSGSDASRLSPHEASTRSLPALTCWITVDGPDDDRVDVAAEQRDDRGSGAGVGHVQQLQPRARREHLHRHVHRPVVPGRAVADRAGPLARVGDEVLQRLPRALGADGENGRVGGEAGDGDELVELVHRCASDDLVRFGQDRDRRQREQQRVAVGLGLRDVPHADPAAGAGLVLDDHGHVEIPAHRVGRRAARRCRRRRRAERGRRARWASPGRRPAPSAGARRGTSAATRAAERDCVDDVRGSTRQNMCWPPLIAMLAPVTNAASSLDRYATSPATSSGLPSRPIGICGMIFESSTSFGIAITIFVPM